ncbi:hypothetical protein MBLNU13_g02952t3 [Cladosporium sp. NU13]
MATPIDVLKAGLANYFKSEEHSDCTIICGPYHFKVHKLAIGVHSEYFRTVMKADTFQEGKTGTIELKAIDPDSDDPEDACDDPEIVELMVSYFHYLDYLHEENAAVAPAVIEVPDSPAPPKKRARKSAPAKKTRASTSAPTQNPLPSSPEIHLIEHAKVFAMAVKYHIAALQNLATHKFQAEVAEHCVHEDLAHAIHVIYTSTADEISQLREVVVEALDAHRDQLLEKPEIATLLRSVTGLACDLLMRSSGKVKPGDSGEVVCYCKNKPRDSYPEQIRCGQCDQKFAGFENPQNLNRDGTYGERMERCPVKE